MTFADHLRAHQDAHNGGGEMPISYGSVCSGIEAATTAWHPLGWSPRWFAEIEPFPSAVLAHHWPEVPNLGDFTLIRDKIAEGAVEAPDVLVGGTPCQAFSVAGLRQSLDDKRGQLTLEFVRLADAIDSARSFRGQRPVTVVWENVPGVLNTPDNAFGCFLAGLVGEDDPLEPPGGRWTNAGYVRGPRRAVAWRILDAQYFGVAQRRRRVFVVASAGAVCPEKVLFEFDGVRRDSPPSREAGQGIAHDVAPGVGASGRGVERPGETRGQDPVVAVQAFAIQERAAHPNLNAGPGGKGYQEGVAYTLEARHHVQACAVTGDVFHTLRAEGFDASEDGIGRGVGAVAVAFQPGNLSRGAGAPPSTQVFPTLKSDHGRGLSDQQPHVAVAFSSKDYGADAGEIAPTMRSMGHDGSHANGGGQLAVAAGFNARQDPDSWVGRTGPLDTDGGTQAVAVALRGREGGAAIEVGDDVGFTLRASQGGGDKPHVMVPVAFQSKQSASALTARHDSSSCAQHGMGVVALPINTQIAKRWKALGRGTGFGIGGESDPGFTLQAEHSHGVAVRFCEEAMQVRRLTPTEAERLQGFPDGQTKIPWRGKGAEDCPDGPRYKALGNSMAVPVMRWIGARIARQLEDAE